MSMKGGICGGCTWGLMLYNVFTELWRIGLEPPKELQ